MPDTSQSSPLSPFIRWTDDEWLQITRHLFIKRGDQHLQSFDLQIIKARDVFLAQEVLLPERHRKLVSIAQGMKSIRERLSAVAQNLPHGDQNEFVRETQLGQRKSRSAQQTKASMLGLSTVKASGSKKSATAHPARQEGSLERQSSPDAEETTSQDLGQVSPANESIAESGGEAAEHTSESRLMPERLEEVLAQQVTLDSNVPTKFSPKLSLLDMARPFIEMVCEEFIKALVKVMYTRSGEYIVQAVLDARRPGAVASREEPFHAATSEELLFRSSHDITNEEDEGPSEADVQPLFDPKLPPSANSDVKPKIGLVGTLGNSFEDLHQLYPQLELTIVQAETESDVRRFGHCQRIIALRGEISPVTDAMLSRLLKHRYVGLNGGVGTVKEQLNAWLAAPESITGAPRRTVPSDSIGENNAWSKKRANRYSRGQGSLR